MHDLEENVFGAGRREGARRFASRLVGDPSAGDDLVQEAWLRVLHAKRNGGYRDRGRFPGYFKSVLTRLCLDEIERRRRSPSLDDPVHAPEGGDPVETGERADAVHGALRDLPTRQRVAVMLRIWDGLDYRGIGALMGVSESNAATLVYRGLKAMESKLRGRWEE